MSSGKLADFISSVSGEDHLAVEENLGAGFVRLRTAEAERRQAKHDIRSVEDVVIEMLRNARDAHAKNVFVAVSREGDVKTFVFVDDGDGVPDALRELIFEPRVTSKLESMVVDRWGVHGRGMALYSIRSNTVESGVVASGSGLGSSFRVVADLNELSERADQSSWPSLVRDDDGKLAVGSGPHNVIRCTVEFALEHKDKISVFLGTPTDICAQLVASGRKELSDEQLLFCDDISQLPVCLRPAAASDALELVDTCAALGLPISERTAHRVMAGQIEPAVEPLSKLVAERKGAKPRQVDIYKDRRGLKIAKDDVSEFSSELEKAFAVLARRYYLHLSETPQVRVGKDCITVRFPIGKDL